MTNRRVFTGKNVQEATAVALETLGAELEDVDIRVINPGRSGIFGLGGALAEIEVAKLSDILVEEEQEAAERQRQMDRATGISDAEEPRPRRQPRQSKSGSRRDRSRRQNTNSGQQQGSAETASTRRERSPQRDRQGAQERPRRQRRSNQRNRQSRRDTTRVRSSEAEAAQATNMGEQPVEQKPTVPNREQPVEQVKLTEDNREELEKVTGEILGYLIAAMNVEVEAYVLDELRDGSIVFEIEGADAGLLIGRRGETLRDVQFIVRMLVNRQLKQRANIIIDVESYQQRRTQKLHTIAENAARAASRGRSRSLDPMTAEERRIVHIALSDNPEVVTESEGQGPERHVVVKPR